MFSDIYPIKRLPRRFRALTYEIPDGMDARRGAVVQIPFRTGTVFGVISATRPKETIGGPFTLKPIIKIFPSILFSPMEMDWFEDLAKDLAQSVPSILYAAMPAFPKSETSDVETKMIGRPLTIPSDEAPLLAATAKHLTSLHRGFVFSSDLRRSAAIISAYRALRPSEPMLIIAPHVRDAGLLQSALSRLSPFFVSGEETTLKRFRAWVAYRKSADGVLIGSRVAALLPHPKIGTIFLVRSSHRDMKQSDQNPRYDARLAALLLSERANARVFFLDAAPRTDDLFFIRKEHFLRPFSLPQPVVADLSKERLVSPHPLLSSTVVQAIAETLEQKKRVLCVYNKRGVARQLSCRDCGFLFLCPACQKALIPYETKLSCPKCDKIFEHPLTCPDCHGARLAERGTGNRAVVNALKRAFPGRSAALLDKETGETKETKTADMVVATQYYLEKIFDPFAPEAFGLVVMLQTDTALFSPTCRAIEQTFNSIAEWQGAAHGMRARFFLQTEHVSLITPFFQDPLAVLAKDLGQRADYHEPPCWRFVTIRPKKQNSSVMERLQTQILKERPDAIVGEEKNGFSLQVHPEAFRALLPLFSTISDDIIIDTSADS